MLLRLIQYHQVRGGVGHKLLTLPCPCRNGRKCPVALSTCHQVWLCVSPGLLGRGEMLQAEGLTGSVFKAAWPG